MSSCVLRGAKVAFVELHLDVSVDNRFEKIPKILNITKRLKYSTSSNLPTSFRTMDAAHLSVHSRCPSFQAPRRTTTLGKLIGMPSHPT